MKSMKFVKFMKFVKSASFVKSAKYVKNIKSSKGFKGFQTSSKRIVAIFLMLMLMLPTMPTVSSHAVTLQVVKCRQSVTLRDRPSTSGRELCQIPLGAFVEAAELPPEGKFCLVTYNGLSGYVLADFLSSSGTNSQPSAQGASAGSVSLRVVKCRQSVTLRDRPSTSGLALCQVPLGAVVQAAAQPPTASGFCAVNYNGISGYILADFLSQN